ncbi:class I SAM-dependent methyltransferase [Paenibacillus wulumuqiensis]|uniref:class I SAM-dependent methyltransferase n=1 Tax=Paenibacillus wulumuqiensis TaxID=1567107 RepID=UPI000696DA88|nr:class I SAM-dependent methyltransferase [Paenibacillus wulumuqiensis]
MLSAAISILLLIMALFVLLSIVYYSWRNGISPLPSSLILRRQVEQEVKRLAAVQQAIGRYAAAGKESRSTASPLAAPVYDPVHIGIQQRTSSSTTVAEDKVPVQGPLIIEAGSGWGTMALHLARYCQPCRVVGIENSLVPLVVSRLLALLPGRAPIRLIRGDMYEYAYEQGDLIVCYLFPGAMTRLNPILRERTRPGTYIISVYFALPDWEPEQVITCQDVHRTRIYIYRTGSRVYKVEKRV